MDHPKDFLYPNIRSDVRPGGGAGEEEVAQRVQDGGPRSRVAQPGTCVGIIVVQRRVANRNANDKLAACFLSSVATPANASFKSQKQCD